LYPTEQDAENAQAEEIENVHKTFKYWFFFYMLNLMSMIGIGIFRHFRFEYEDSNIIRAIYYLFGGWWLAMWGLGLHLRF